MAHVGEEGSFRLEEVDEGDGLFQVRMAEVRGEAKSVEDEDVEILEEGQALGRKIAHIGEIGSLAKAVAGGALAAVDEGDGLEAGSEKGNGRGKAGGRVGKNAMDLDAGGGGVAQLGIEGVAEDSFEALGGGFVGIERERVLEQEGERAKVVHAEDVVGMTVSVEDGVHAADVLAEGLGVEVGAGVDQDGMAFVLDPDRRPGAPVVWVGRGADGAGAAEGRNAHGGAAAEEGESDLHGCGVILSKWEQAHQGA